MAPASLLRALLAVSLAAAPASGQDPAQLQTPAQAPTIEEVQARIDALQGAGQTVQAGASELLEVHRQALAELERAQKLRQSAAELEARAKEAPALLESIRAELAQPPAKDEPPVPEGASLRDLEQRLTQAEADRTAAQASVSELSAELQRRGERLGVIAGEVAKANQEIQTLQESLQGSVPADLLAAARRELVLCRIAAHQADVDMLEKERTAYEARRELLPLRRDKAQRQLVRAQQLASLWLARVSERRQQEAEKAARDAERQRRETTARFPQLARIATENEKLASLRSGDKGYPARIADARQRLEKAKTLLNDVHIRFRNTRRRVKAVGLTEGMGVALRRDNNWLPTDARLRSDSMERRDALSKAQLLQIELEEAREETGDVVTWHARVMDEIQPGWEPSSPSPQSQLALELLRTQRELQDSLIAELTTYINALTEHEDLYDGLAVTVDEFRTYIEERILWVRSSAERVPDIELAIAGLTTLVASPDWAEGLRRMGDETVERLGLTISYALLLAFLVAFRRRARRMLAVTSEEVRSYRTDRISLTLRALADTAYLSLPGPVALWVLGQLLKQPPGQVEIALAVGSALQRIAPVLFTLTLLRRVARPKGLGEAHFRWPGASTAVLRRSLRWFIPVVVPLTFLVAVFDYDFAAPLADSIGRLAFVAFQLAGGILIYRLLRPGSDLLADFLGRASGLVQRTYKLWFALALGLPSVLIVAASAGYYYTALQLDARLRLSVRLAVVLVLVNALLLRWLFIARRRLAIEQARARAQARAEAAADNVEDGGARESGASLIDEDKVDIPAVDAQTRQLFRSGITITTVLGLFFIWAGAFPALRALDRVILWPRLEIVSASAAESGAAAPAVPESSEGTGTAAGAVPGAASTGLPMPTITPQETASSTTDKEVAEAPGSAVVITLADLGLALVILLIMVAATKNIPGLLEISVLQRLPLDGGSRYAISTLVRYLILIIGITSVFGALGLGWSRIQWLAAALTFGLAFGLQEIFANFVSGLIILVERPVRVGDIVTVGGIEGRVTRLRMRSTTVLDWDRREMLIPNKDFITGTVTNWTLSDPVTRLVIPVGIAYGSDTKRARELLLQSAKTNPRVLEEPAPSAIFRAFGDSSLNFELRIFIASRDFWPEVIDRLHTQIDDAFRAAGIEIAFPQRDLHIRSAEGLRELAGREARTTSSGEARTPGAPPGQQAEGTRRESPTRS